MRKFRSVNNDIRRTLECSFSTLTNPLKNKIPEDYTPYAISVFEGRLDEEQSEKLLVNVSVSVGKERISKLNKFSIRLMSEFDAYSFKLAGIRKKNILYKEFTSKNAKIEYVTQVNMGNFKVLLPEIVAAYYEGYDYTNILWLKGRNDNLAKIEYLANEYGLFLWNAS